MGAIIEDVLATRLDLLGLGPFRAGFQSAAAAIGVLDTALDASGQKLLNYSAVYGAAGLGIAAGLVKAVQSAGRIETITTAFTTLEGSVDGARARIGELQEFAAKSPFDFQESARAGQQLRAVGIEGNKLIPIMEAAGNAVSAAGGNTETFQGVLNAISQIKTAGKLQGDELNQMANRGVPAARLLMKELGKTREELTNLPADQVIDALVRAFNKEYAGGMEAQSKTLEGRLSSLADSANQLGAIIGGPLLGPVTGAVKVLTDLVNVATNAPPAIQGLLGPLAAAGAGFALLRSFQFGKQIVDLGKLAAENVKNENAANKAAAEAEKEGSAVDKAGGAAKRAATSHQSAAAAAEQYATALDRLAAAATRTAPALEMVGAASTLAAAPATSVEQVVSGTAGGGGRTVRRGGKTTGKPTTAAAAAPGASVAETLAADLASSPSLDDSIDAIFAGGATQPAGNAVAAAIAADLEKSVDDSIAGIKPVAAAKAAEVAEVAQRTLTANEAGFPGALPLGRGDVTWRERLSGYGERLGAGARRAGEFLGSERGAGVLTGAAVLGNMVVQAVPTEAGTPQQTAKDALSAGLTGAALGAQVGALAGPIGAAAGAAIGGLGSAIITAISADTEKRQAKEAEQKKEDGKDEQIRLLQQQLDELKGLRTAAAFDTANLPGAVQVGLAADLLQ